MDRTGVRLKFLAETPGSASSSSSARQSATALTAYLAKLDSSSERLEALIDRASSQASSGTSSHASPSTERSSSGSGS